MSYLVTKTKLPYARHYNPRFVYFYVLFDVQKRFLKGFFLNILALCMVSIQERFQIKSGLWWRVYGIQIAYAQKRKGQSEILSIDISCHPSQNQQATYKAYSEMNMHFVNENTN